MMAYRVPVSADEFARYLQQIEPLKKGLDLVRDHVVITDTNGNILYANKAVEERTGFPIHEVIGRNPGDLWGGNMSQEFYKKMWRAIKTEKMPFIGEVKNKRKDGTEYWQELHISPVLDKEGNVRFFIAIEPDITERKEKDKFREDFFSALGHQGRQPLTAIRWLLESVLERGELAKDQIEKLKEIYAQSENLTDLFQDLLILARLGADTLEKTNIDLWDEVGSMLNSIKRGHPEIVFSAEKSGASFPLYVNKRLAQQIFINLISNAAEYANSAEPKVDISLKKEGDSYLFSVKNNGLTISKEDKPKIFSQFFRAEGAKERKEKGTGLGLYIVKLCCDLFGWQIWFESPPPEEREGAIFFVRIPIS